MRGSKILLTAAATAALSLAGFAQTATPAPNPTPDPAFQQGQAPPPSNLPSGVKADSVRGRNKVEADRIEQGVDNGSLTKQEATQLKHDEKRLQHEEKTMAASNSNGKLTKAQQEKLTRQQNTLSHKIRKDRHN
ncbi:MAG: hypothetical protein H0X25_11275 [Acidobacteriales bacterium]|nr:hypothetical protein [Terriglobales bacterium]